MLKSEDSFIKGKFLYYAFISDGNQVLKNQAEINRINIFLRGSDYSQHFYRIEE
jgi:hypothetical protein